jgi:hypothetical protein
MDNLRRLPERNGALEITVDRTRVDAARPGPEGVGDIVWRVRVLRVTETEVLVEPPAAFGASLSLGPGVELIGAMTIGQNRWMFHTRTLGAGPNDRVLALALPEGVERCARRSFFRISTANLTLPRVQCWPLVDPGSAAAAEAANRAEIHDLLSGVSTTPFPTDIGPAGEPTPVLLPEVGPMFRASLLNVSGGGLGLLVAPEDAPALGARPYLWIRLDLRPHIPAPASVTARVTHTHTDSGQHIYAGLAFDFGHNPAHRKFIVELFGQYVESLQRAQRENTRAAA